MTGPPRSSVGGRQSSVGGRHSAVVTRRSAVVTWRSSLGGHQSTVAGPLGRLRPRFLNPKGSHFSGGSTIQTGTRKAACRRSDSRSRQTRTSDECKGTYTWENSQSKGG